jgi:beta-glucosidase
MGHEFALVGAHTPLAIVAGPMGRSVYDGRTWEGFGVDPYLSGVATALSVEGFQKNGVSGLIKHFFGSKSALLASFDLN